MDYSEKLIAFAKDRHSSEGVEFHARNIKDFEADRMFDVVLMVGVLHHLDDMQDILRQILSRVRPGGLIVVNEPHPGNPFVTLLRKIRKKTDANYSEDQVELSWSELEDVFEEAGLVDIKLKPQGVFSTPFAEVVLKPQALFVPVAKLACLLDNLLERLPTPVLKYLTWNIVAVGRKP
ncbi:MAG: methyltransferase domain-containing protein [Pseudomonadota bacterium]